MNEDYNKIDREILEELIEGNIHDIYTFVKRHCYKDMYMTIYDYTFKDLNIDDDLDRFIKITLRTYKRQNKLNKSLKITDGKYFDNYLLSCIVGRIFETYEEAKALEEETKQTFKDKVLKKEQESLDHLLNGEYNTSFLTGLIRNKFSDKNEANIDEVIKYIESLSKDNDNKVEETDLLEYFNDLITRKKVTLNQLGTESLIKKGIYELSLGKQPTKNQLIMLIFALKLDKEESDTLFKLAKEKIKNNYDSNIYSFDSANERDNLLLHWMNNINQLEIIANKRNKYIVEIINSILKESNFAILK